MTVAKQIRRSSPRVPPPRPSAEAPPWAPPSSTAASTSACSRGPPRASNSCSSTARTTPRPSRVIRIDPATNRTYHYWHVFVPGVRPGQLYGYRVDGPSDPASGLRFDPAKVLLDPYGRGVVVPKDYDREAARRRGRQRRDGDEERGRRSGRVRLGGRRSRCAGRPRAPSSTRCTSAGSRATRVPASARRPAAPYAGLIEKIPYLQELGITAVELLPVFAFDAQACPPGLVNYWGYQPVSFFAPHPAYSSRQDPLGPVDDSATW